MQHQCLNHNLERRQLSAPPLPPPYKWLQELQANMEPLSVSTPVRLSCPPNRDPAPHKALGMCSSSGPL